MELFLLIALFVVNGLLAMSEVALLTSKRSKLNTLANRGNKSASIALRISEDPTQFLSTIQIGITSIGLLSGIVGETIFASPLSSWLQSLGLQQTFADVSATIVVVVLVTYLSITIGELVPKRIGQSQPEKIASLVAGPMLFLSKITAPFVYILSISTNALLRLLGIRPHHSSYVTEDEIEAILEEGLVAGLIENQERELVKNVFRLDDRALGSLMVPRTEVVFVDINDSDEESFDLISQSVRSKIPVCDGDLDSIIGILSAKTALATVARGESLSLRENLEPAMFVPETLTGMDLLERFKETNTHIAFVVDEHGAVTGLVTLQDIFDSLVGEIPAEGQEQTSPVQRDDGSWLFEGDTPIPEFKDALSIDEVPGENKGKYHTLSGLVLLVLERMPEIGDSVEVDSWKLEVIDMDGKRIDKVMASRLP
ncbi:hemolysin family protein [Aurantimicrobium minutum]|uniref:CBS-containing domain containing hemolysin n=1 Tax=Aurantimicrobium minutum TaxID=708131 RepID=A0A173LWS8_9MICO|nr:hemolysin family protein [Aurantimicrobium minutum]BAU99312.1 CBS-containing domain containing hemolysin [Aurantimicrobium minutum]